MSDKKSDFKKEDMDTSDTPSSLKPAVNVVTLQQKALTILIRPWSIVANTKPLVYQILDNRLLKIIHFGIDNLHVVIRYHERSEKMKANETKIEKVSHMKFMNERHNVNRSELMSKTDETIEQMQDIFPQKPLLLNQTAVRRMEFKECSPDYVPKEPLLEMNLPFVLPASIMLNVLTEFVNNSRHWLHTYKLDGIRLYWCFMTIGEQKLAIWCNRKGKCWIMPNKELNIPDDMYDGTVWDAELTLLKDGKTVAFTIHNSLSSCGKVCGQTTKIYRQDIAHHNVEIWNAKYPSSVPTPSNHPYFRPAYSVERWVRPDFVVRVKQFYGTRDYPFLLDRVMPFLDQHVDGVISETAEDSCLVKPKKYKLDHPPDFRIKLHKIDSQTNEGWYTLWTFHRKKPQVDIQWTEHGLLSIPKSCLPSGCSFQDMHNVVAEVLFQETKDKKSVSFKSFRDQEKLFPNEISTIRDTLANYRQAIMLHELLPKEMFVDGGYRVPNGAKVIEMRHKLGLSWGDFCAETFKIPLPDPIIHVPIAKSVLQKAWKDKVSPYSLNGMIYMQSRVS